MIPFISPNELRARGVLGINRRNAEFILPGNPRAFYPRVDDKLITKTFCEPHGIPVPETYAVIERQGDLRRFSQIVGDRQQFVIKPCKGAEGRGIVVIAAHDRDHFTAADGETWTLPELRYHLETLLAGLYSLGGQPDRILIEQRIIRHPVFEPIAVGGTPDVRVVLYRGVPVMAMVRLPTHASRGRANLHQGAVAAGIDLATGTTFGGVCQNRIITHHPDTHTPIAGVAVPHWPELLNAAMKLADVLELAYLGVDFVLDAARGPVVLEANARPGLAIQIANRRGLLPRLRQIESANNHNHTPAERLRLVQQWQSARSANPTIAI
jgi:alpha-L-glutamate ligase-like protein